MSFINEVEQKVPYEGPITPKENEFAMSMFQGLMGFMLQMGKNVIQWDRQDKLIADQRKWQKEMFNLENAYNSPVAMAQRMRHAGLNPYAMTGQQVAGSFNAGSYPSATPIEDPFENLVKAAQIANINADTRKKDSEADISYQEARKKAVEANNWDEYWKITLENLRSAGNLTDAQIETEKAKARREFELARKAAEEANQLEDYGDTGGNIFGDAGAVSQSQVRLNDSITALNAAKTEYQNITNSNADASQKSEIQERLASAQKSFADALAAQMQTKYTETLNNNATAQEARNAALYVFELAIKQYDADVRFQDSVVRHMEAMREEAKTKNPFNDKRPEGLASWLFYNLFGDDGMLNL